MFLFQCDIEFTLIKVIEAKIVGDGPTCITWHKAGLAVSGPDKVIRVSQTLISNLFFVSFRLLVSIAVRNPEHKDRYDLII